MSLVIGEGLRLAAKKYPKKTAVVSQDRQLTFEELNCRANRLANGFLSLGLVKGDKVAVLLYNCLEWPEIYYGLAKAGLVMVPVSFRFEAPEIQNTLEHSGSKALIFGQEFLDKVQLIRRDLKKVKFYICIGETVDQENYEKFLEQSSGKEPQPKTKFFFIRRKSRVEEKDIFFISYTSGTTGKPKGAVRTHRSDVINVMVSALELGFSEDTVGLLVMPLFHCNSIWFGLSILSVGGKVVIHHSGRYNPIEILQTIDREKVTFISLVPTHYFDMVNLPKEEKEKHDVSSLVTALCSSAPLDDELKKEILNFFKSAKLHEAYGATETGMVTHLRPEDQEIKTECAGQPVYGTELIILDEEGKEVPCGETGELFIQNDASLEGYHENPEAFQKASRGKWLSVGDMFRQDEEGYFYFMGRKDFTIITGGEKVQAEEVEKTILKHHNVQEVVVIGMPHKRWGEAVKAIVVLREGTKATADEIISFCRGKLASFKIPKSVDLETFKTTLPKKATGKVDRGEVKKILNQSKS